MLREKYGAPKINFKLFPDSSIEEYSSFVLRNSGNDFNLTHFRDAMHQQLVKNIDIDCQLYRPVIVYLNGEYWGIYNLREKQNEEYLASHHDVDPENIDLLESNAVVIEGDAEHYNYVYNFIANHNLDDAANFAYVNTQFDIDELINYYVAQIYYDNRDWPGNNLKYWRPKTMDGKWRWLLFDTDYGFGLKSPTSYTYDTLKHATATDGYPWQNPPWSTLILRKLIENKDFRNDFINRFMDYFNTIFAEENVLRIIKDMKEEIQPEMASHIERWGLPTTLTEWDSNVQVLEEFAAKRPEFVYSHLNDMFDIGDKATVELNVSDCEAGCIKINSLTIKEFPWKGTYCTGVPVALTAVPKPGFRFAGWENYPQFNSSSMSVSINDSVSFKAVIRSRRKSKM